MCWRGSGLSATACGTGFSHGNVKASSARSKKETLVRTGVPIPSWKTTPGKIFRWEEPGITLVFAARQAIRESGGE